jgi:hypothetical protein
MAVLRSPVSASAAQNQLLAEEGPSSARTRLLGGCQAGFGAAVGGFDVGCPYPSPEGLGNPRGDIRAQRELPSFDGGVRRTHQARSLCQLGLAQTAPAPQVGEGGVLGGDGGEGPRSGLEGPGQGHQPTRRRCSPLTLPADHLEPVTTQPLGERLLRESPLATDPAQCRRIEPRYPLDGPLAPLRRQPAIGEVTYRIRQGPT